ncbi:MAG: DUF5412 family protein [bacterium]|nr:DUF5412 family protein [bacterium]
MKKTGKLISIILAVVIVLNVGFFISDSFFYNIDTLPKGEFLFSSMSPTGQYTVRFYVVNAGKTLSSAIRGELVDVNTGDVKNIYWEAGVNNAFAGWLSDTIISVNEHAFDVVTQVYDWRDAFGPEKLPDGKA